MFVCLFVFVLVFVFFYFFFVEGELCPLLSPCFLQTFHEMKQFLQNQTNIAVNAFGTWASTKSQVLIGLYIFKSQIYITLYKCLIFTPKKIRLLGTEQMKRMYIQIDPQSYFREICEKISFFSIRYIICTLLKQVPLQYFDLFMGFFLLAWSILSWFYSIFLEPENIGAGTLLFSSYSKTPHCFCNITLKICFKSADTLSDPTTMVFDKVITSS